MGLGQHTIPTFLPGHDILSLTTKIRLTEVENNTPLITGIVVSRGLLD